MDAKTYYERELRKYNESDTDLRSPDEFSIDCMREFAKEMNGKLLPEPKLGQRLTEMDVFHLVIYKPGWYVGIMSKQLALYFKKSFLRGTLNQGRKDRFFAKFGYRRVETICEEMMKILYYQPDFRSYGVAELNEVPKDQDQLIVLNRCEVDLTPIYRNGLIATSTKKLRTMSIVRVLTESEHQEWMNDLYTLA